MRVYKKFYFASNSLFLMLVIATISVLSACKGSNSSGPTEGIIEYELKVLDNKNPILTTDLLPGTMVTRFKNNCMSQELSAGMGMFSTSFVSNLEKKSVYQTLQMLGKKYTCIADSVQLIDIISKEPVLKFELVPGEKVIAGYNCKKAIAKYADESKPPIEVYYTEEISVKDPNFYFNYNQIKGVLMEFNVTRYMIEMRLTAKSVKNEEVPDSYFNVDSSSKMVSLEEMNGYFTGGK
jgi:GLPGLI family protein